MKNKFCEGIKAIGTQGPFSLKRNGDYVKDK